MKKFIYRLQRVLEVREKTEEETKHELTRRRQELQQAQDLLARIDKKRLETTSLDIVLYDLQGFYLARLLQEREVALKDIVEKTKHVEETEILFLVARREAEILRKLKKKKLNQYNQKLESFESQVLDEIATLRYGRE
jgi:flagellar export protein FliJ